MNKKNKEGYKDPTAHEAIQNVMNESKEKRMKRGEVYYIEPYDKSGIGSEQRAGRPAVIVSNDKCNEYSEVLEVVYLTTQPKADLPTHVTIRSTPRESTALCEQITSVSTSRFGDMVCRLSKDELVNIEIGCLISLDLSTGSKEKVITKEVVKEVPVEVIKEVIKEVPAPPLGGSRSWLEQEICGSDEQTCCCKCQVRYAPVHVRFSSQPGHRKQSSIRRTL